jgi:Tfp pilus assembly protein PilX
VGRARLWLTFDEIHVSTGWVPLVADLIDAPGVHSIRVLYDREGEIRAAETKQEDIAFAAAEAAFVGAEPGIVAKNKQDAAMGAAISAATAFMITSGLGQELTLPQNLKLELALARPLYLGKT